MACVDSSRDPGRSSAADWWGVGDIDRTPRPQHLELAAHIARMEQLHHGKLARAEATGFGGGQPAQNGRSMVHEKCLLGFDDRRVKTVGGQGFTDPVPADVAGQILFAGLGEQGVVLSVAGIGAHRAGWSFLGEFPPGFPIVNGDEQP